VIAINLISSPGSGKTLLLEKTLEALNGKIKCAVITGDQQTDNDAQRLADKGAKIYQIETKTSCHLNAEQVATALPEGLEEGTQLLFIENVGNMVCPTAFELGEHFKVALLSTPEGEDKPEKYPVLFATAKLALLTKMDLAELLDWDLKACQRSIQSVHPGMMTLKLSAKTGDGMEAWLDYLASLT
jgi:hydrogenase nickel incorporation protein HypB